LTLREVGSKMDCNDARIMIFDDVRRHLLPEERARLSEHVSGCEACAHELPAEEALTDALTNRLSRPKAPPPLLRPTERRSSEAPRDGLVGGLRRPAWWSAWAAAAVLALSLSGFAAYRSTLRPTDGDLLTREAINDHLRITFSEHPVEVASGGIHQVKPW